MAVETTFEVPPGAVTPARTSVVVTHPREFEYSALRYAVSNLYETAPHLSAATPFWWRQIAFFGVVAGIAAAAFVLAPKATWNAVLMALAVPFACIVIYRVAALALLPFNRPSLPADRHVASDASLPTYSVLVPLYGEANMAPQIMAALTALDYPVNKLEILIILEANDLATRQAFAAYLLPQHVRVLVVPGAHPQTKPKALNFALFFARGDYVVVYDAEDLPDPAQLRNAAQTFAIAPPDVACLQARLLIHNASDGWLARHFSLEYIALFDGLLPAYQTLGCPLPLGGTSNHFPRALLQDLGGWDPYNVTEDADLGIRLARRGLKARVLASDTWEEAPALLSDWLPQRTRWLKGWMQTWLVHTRQPIRLLRELGFAACAGFHILFGGMLLAALVHPIMYVLLVWQFMTIGPFATPFDSAGWAFTAVSASNLALGYLSAMVLCAVCAMKRGWVRLSLHILTLPLYWLLISVAAWRALFQLFFAPFKWEKTQHRAHR